MSLELKSLQLKQLLTEFDTAWFLGNLSSLMSMIASYSHSDQLQRLSSPMRQLFYLGGLLMSSDPSKGRRTEYSMDEWNELVTILNEIELEYQKIFFPQAEDEMTDEWKRVREVAMPSFLSYFNQGPLNYVEQVLNWIQDLYSPLNQIVYNQCGLTVDEFLHFYNNLDNFLQNNFNGHMSPLGNLRENWEAYARAPLKLRDSMPERFKLLIEDKKRAIAMIMDYGIAKRFYPQEIISDSLSLEKVDRILELLSCSRSETNFIYYTSQNPGNPLYAQPIVNIGSGMYQIFEITQVARAIDTLLESYCSSSQDAMNMLSKWKGQLLEERIEELFKELFNDSEVEAFRGYYVDGNEQDILVLYQDVAFVIEAKAYKLREPLRDPNRAFPRINDDFNRSIGYAFEQCNRVKEKFKNKSILELRDEQGQLLKIVDTSLYSSVYSIIVNITSFNQVQNDLATLLGPDKWGEFPWAVTLNDLEVFIKTFISYNIPIEVLFEFLSFRSTLHGRLFCSDELEVSGGFLQGVFNDPRLVSGSIRTHPDFTKIYDDLYHNGMGLRNERHLDKKGNPTYLQFR